MVIVWGEEVRIMRGPRSQECSLPAKNHDLEWEKRALAAWLLQTETLIVSAYIVGRMLNADPKDVI
jgi:hypothetical protein